MDYIQKIKLLNELMLNATPHTHRKWKHELS
jgi:hypothetical protein